MTIMSEPSQETEEQCNTEYMQGCRDIDEPHPLSDFVVGKLMWIVSVRVLISKAC